jgi:hypothetical protein
MALSNNYNVKVGDKIPDALIGKYSNIVSKAIEDPNKLTNNGGKDIEHQDYFHAMGIAEQTSSIIDTNKEILELFPDIKIATDVRVSAIIDPNSQEDEEFKNAVDLLFEELERDEPNHFAVRQYKKYKLAAGVVSLKRLLNQSILKSWSSKMIKKSLEAYFFTLKNKIVFCKKQFQNMSVFCFVSTEIV